MIDFQVKMYHFNTRLGSKKLNRVDTLLTIKKDVSILMVIADQAKTSKNKTIFDFLKKNMILNFTKMPFSKKIALHIFLVKACFKNVLYTSSLFIFIKKSKKSDRTL